MKHFYKFLVSLRMGECGQVEKSCIPWVRFSTYLFSHRVAINPRPLFCAGSFSES